jgi:proteasome accessory factor C
MSENSLIQVARALDLIPYLVANPGSSIASLAEQFGTSELQISRDLALLHMCGLPGYSHLELIDINYDDPDFVEVTDAQVLDQPRRLTGIEAISIVLGLEILESISTDADVVPKISQLRTKISLLLKEHEIEFGISEEVIASTPYLDEIRRAIATHHHLIFEYASGQNDSISERTVLPISLDLVRGYGYLLAWEIEKAALRTFRVDRIAALQTGNSFEPDLLTSLSPSEIDQKGLSAEPEIIARLSFDDLGFLEDHRGIIIDSRRHDEYFTIVMKPVSHRWVIQTLAGLRGPVVIEAPMELSQEFQTFVKTTLASYDI